MARTRSLWPREHGAYPQLLAPLAAALAIGRPGLAAASLAAAAVLAFLAHEPLLIVLGHRGARLRADLGARARRRLVALGLVALAAGLTGLVLAPTAALATAAVVALPIAGLLGLAWSRREHTLAGELVAAVALTGISAPIAAAAGVPLATAFALWLAWSAGFAASVVAVHRVLARHRNPPSVIEAVVVIVLTLLTVMAALAALHAPGLAAIVPLAIASAVLVARPPSARRLRAVGVGLTVAAVVAAVLVVVAVRSA